jgi:Zn-dependent protease with chaperone function
MGPLPQLPLEPLPYHQDLIAHLALREQELWTWCSAERVRAEQGEAVRLELLKATYRLEPEAHPALHEVARAAAAALGLEAPLTLYQAHASGGLNASLAYLPGEVHVVLHGPIADRLTPLEQRAVLGHELAHFLLLERWSAFRVAAQVLSAMAGDRAAEPVHQVTARRFGLYTEVYCDRGAHRAAGDLGAAVSALVKVETGIAEASAESYLRQAEEIFAKGSRRTEGVTHPESFVRARALARWVEAPGASAGDLREMIEGPLTLAELDLLGQGVVAERTRRLIAAFLGPAWLRTEPLLAHARLFFDDLAPAAAPDPGLADAVQDGDDALRDYWCYVLLDFATADRDLEEAPLAAALLLAEQLGLGDRLRKIAARELGMKKKQLDGLEARAEETVRAAAAAEGEA